MLLRLKLRELLLCGFIENHGAIMIGGAFGLLWELGFMDRFFVPVFGQPGRGVIRDLGRSIVSNATLSWERMALIAVAILGVLLLIRVFSMVWAVVRLYGFTLRLVDDDARTEFGLLTRVAMTIPLRRIQALTVLEGPLHRLFERVAVKVDTAGGKVGEEHTQSEREYVAPILPAAATSDFTNALVGVGLEQISWHPAHPRAFRREVKGWLVPAIVMCAVLAFLLRWYSLLLFPVPFLWAVIGARQTVKHLGWALLPDAVLFKRGWLWRRTVVVRFAKMQTVSYYETPFDRRNDMARIHVDVAGASDASRINIPYLGRGEADELFAHLSSQAARHQFRW
jgi:putative membrane protein